MLKLMKSIIGGLRPDIASVFAEDEDEEASPKFTRMKIFGSSSSCTDMSSAMKTVPETEKVQRRLVKRFVGVATRCWHQDPAKRPTMASVIDTLEELLVDATTVKRRRSLKIEMTS